MLRSWYTAKKKREKTFALRGLSVWQGARYVTQRMGQGTVGAEADTLG